MFEGGGSSSRGRLPILVRCSSLLCGIRTQSFFDSSVAARVWNTEPPVTYEIEDANLRAVTMAISDVSMGKLSVLESRSLAIASLLALKPQGEPK
jgi:hypothetical protein